MQFTILKQIPAHKLCLVLLINASKIYFYITIQIFKQIVDNSENNI